MINNFRGDYWFLSNFYPHPITASGRTWPTNEHYFQAMKTLDVDEQERIREANTPREAKYLGRQLKDIIPNWDSMRFLVMRNAIASKFPSKGTELTLKLLETLPHALVEGNAWGDTFWGVRGATSPAPRQVFPGHEELKVGYGLNWLGYLLMARRAELLDEEVWLPFKPEDEPS